MCHTNGMTAVEDQFHTPVLLSEVLQYLHPREGESYLDLTGGYGGHASKVLALTRNYKGSVLVDRDETAVGHLSERFKETEVQIMHKDFCEAALELVENGHKFDLILGDFGVSSVQLDTDSRGFSFSSENNLDMRMDQSQTLTAAAVVNRWGEKELARVFEEYGEVRRGEAARVAQKIVHNRPIDTTTQLAELILRAVGGGYRRRHPATQYFQAIRIAVNDELRQIERTLELIPGLLNKGGRVGLISFHSLEDRLVKNYFAGDARRGLESQFRIVTKSPVVATRTEIDNNPRARSAKLRVAMKA